MLKKHVLGSHKDKIEKESQFNLCEVCGKYFTNKINLENHTRMHLPIEQRQQFECIFCKQTFAYKKSLIHHMAAHLGEKKKYHCDKCSVNFSRMDALRRHTLIHLGQKHHSCQVCGKGFRTKFNLKVKFQ